MEKLSSRIRYSLILFYTCVSLLITVVVFSGNLPVSGSVVDGYRVLPVKESSDSLQFTVFRGDYIKFDLDESIIDPVLIIPDLNIQEKLPGNLSEAPYFKMKNTGTHAFSLGGMTGKIDVIDYQQPNYKEVTAKEAAKLIENIQPLVLDVRTPFEYQQGHLADAVLIPVQELQSRWTEISDYKNQDILIYCATGNRSTVASKILIDSGFKRILNLRYGIADWRRSRFPIVK